MAILKYIPRKSKIIDRRTENGGYYEATCDVCGTIFYPKRNTAKYCSHPCAIHAYRERNSKKTESKMTKVFKEEKKQIANPIVPINTKAIGINALIELLQKMGADTRRDKAYIKDALKSISTGKDFLYLDKQGNSFYIKKLSQLKFNVSKDDV